MRKYTSYLSSGNRLPIRKEIHILSDYGNILPTKDITLNSYKETDELLRSTEVARIGSFVANYVFFLLLQEKTLITISLYSIKSLLFIGKLLIIY